MSEAGMGTHTSHPRENQPRWPGGAPGGKPLPSLAIQNNKAGNWESHYITNFTAANHQFLPVPRVDIYQCGIRFQPESGGLNRKGNQ
jgi:hypothetical protein